MLHKRPKAAFACEGKGDYVDSIQDIAMICAVRPPGEGDAASTHLSATRCVSIFKPEEADMSNTPLMPKATAVWLVDNTALTFEQIGDFCKLHPLEVKGIADGEVAQGIKGLDPISSGQLSRDEIDRAENDPTVA